MEWHSRGTDLQTGLLTDNNNNNDNNNNTNNNNNNNNNNRKKKLTKTILQVVCCWTPSKGLALVCIGRVIGTFLSFLLVLDYPGELKARTNSSLLGLQTEAWRGYEWFQPDMDTLITIYNASIRDYHHWEDQAHAVARTQTRVRGGNMILGSVSDRNESECQSPTEASGNHVSGISNDDLDKLAVMLIKRYHTLCFWLSRFLYWLKLMQC